MGPFGRFRRDARGSVAVIVALLSPVIVGFAALSVDVGSIYLTSRHLQGVADLAALAAASDLPNASADAQSTADANRFDAPVRADTVTGRYQANAAIPAAQRFTAGGAPTAAHVTLTGQAPLYFGKLLTGRSSFVLSRSATAATARLAAFSIGSRLASLQGGIANAILSGLTGSTVSLSALDYNALASANVDLFDYTSALRTRTNLQAASFSQALSGHTTSSVALLALADALTAEGNGQAAGAARTLAAAGGATPVNLTNLIDLGPYADQDHVAGGSGAAIAVDALDLADAELALAGGGRQVQLNLGATVPGLASTAVWLAIGQRPSNSPWIAIDDAGTVIVRTAQARLYVDAQVLPAAGALSGLGVSVVDVPIYVELAQAQAKLAAITCGASPSVDLSVQPSVGEIALGAVDTGALNNFTQSETVKPATLVNLLLLKATAIADVHLGGASWQTVHFTNVDIAAHTVKTVQTNDIATASVASLVANTHVTVQLAGLGLGIGAGPVTSSLQGVLTTAAAPLDSVIDGLTAFLGVHLGEADVRVNGVRCNAAALVG